MDATDTFTTGNHMRDALGNLSAYELEGLLIALEDHPQTDPKFNTVRNSLFNYLALADPSRALGYTLEHPDKQSRQLFAAQAIKYVAKSDLVAAREALDQISDQNLRISAPNTPLSVAVETGSAEIVDMGRALGFDFEIEFTEA